MIEPALQQTNNVINNLFSNCCTLTRVIRVIAWILRFYTNALRNATTIMKLDTEHLVAPNYLTTSELNHANNIIRIVQQLELKKDNDLLCKRESVHFKSNICKLNPYLDKEGKIRAGGRLNKSTMPAGMKNPAIILRNSRLTKLMTHEAHLATLHGGARLTHSYIRQQYWIVGGNRAVKSQLRRCVRCHQKQGSKENYQLMADLPPQRVTPSRPFTHTGVDFTSHVDIKLNKGRGVKTSKGYISIFVCLATKAVHIELVLEH